MGLIHHMRLIVSLISKSDCLAGELLVVLTGQDDKGLHNVSHIDDKSHEYCLCILPVKPEVIITFVERCVNNLHVLVEGIEPHGSSSDNNCGSAMKWMAGKLGMVLASELPPETLARNSAAFLCSWALNESQGSLCFSHHLDNELLETIISQML